MREAIRIQLVTKVAEVAGRVFEPQAADAHTEKPYLVVLQGVDVEDTLWTGFRRVFEVWPYVSRTSFVNVDSLEKKVIDALHGQLMADPETGEVFTCQYIGGAGPDVVDNEWDLITRGVRFAALSLQPVGGGADDPFAVDPWIVALAAWTRQQLGDTWNVYENIWPLGYERPAVLWRISGIPAVDALESGSYRVTKTITGHVVGSSPNQESAGILQVIEAIGAAIKIPLDAPAKKFMLVNAVAAAPQPNSIALGQITLTLSRRTAKPSQEGPPIQAVKIASRSV